MVLEKSDGKTFASPIPYDWSYTTIGSQGKFDKGRGIRKNEAASGDIPCVRYGEIYTHHSDIIRSFNSFISAQVAKTSQQIKTGDILFAGSGETKAEIGKCTVFIGTETAFAGSDIVIFQPLNTHPIFLAYALNSPQAVRQKASRGQGDAVVHISAKALSTIEIPLPQDFSEQQAIAEALSDADTLIESLEQLFTKKRLIKQGAMQGRCRNC